MRKKIKIILLLSTLALVIVLTLPANKVSHSFKLSPVHAQSDSIFAYSIEEAMKNPDLVIGLWLDGHKSFPKEVLLLPNLKKLHIVNCDFLAFPDEISTLDKVFFVEIAKMSHIPKGISQLKQLQALWLSDVSIFEIPKEVLKLKGLNHFFAKYCDSVNLENLPYIKSAWFHSVDSAMVAECICNWKELEYLSFSDVSMSKLPGCISGLKFLKELEIDFTNLKTLPAEIAQLSSLRKIEVSLSYLSELPDDIFNMDSLHTIILKDNKLNMVDWDSVLRDSPIDTIEIVQDKAYFRKP